VAKRCSAVYENGEQCRNPALHGSPYCARHQYLEHADALFNEGESSDSNREEPRMPQYGTDLPDFQFSKSHVLGAIVFLGVLLLFWFGSSTYYIVEADEEAVVLRFGECVAVSGPGLHFKLPFGIDEAITVVKRVQEEEFGFRTRQAGVVTQYEYARGGEEQVSLMLTGDLNCAVVHWVVRYKIDDAENYVLKVRNVEGTIRDAAEAVMRRSVGDKSIDEVISIDREKIAVEAKAQIQEILDAYESGILIDAVKLKDATPPDRVKPAFNAVNEARQNKDRAINEAEGIRNSRIPAAKGEKEKLIQEAEGYAIRVKNEALGDIAKFEAILKEYENAVDVTRRRLYLETMAKVLPEAGRVFVVDESQKSILPLLQLGEKGGVR